VLFESQDILEEFEIVQKRITFDLSMQSANKKQELAKNQYSTGTLYHQLYNAVLKYFSCLGINGAGLTQYEDQIRSSI
jgi:hypothetical protein